MPPTHTTQLRALDLATLTPMDALDLAILVEEEARERYEELTHQMLQHRTPDAARFFLAMRDNEEKHRLSLRERRRARFGEAPSRITRAMLFDVEAPAYDEVRAFMTWREALEVAMRAELGAATFFAEALSHSSDPEVLDLFGELHAEELEHLRLVTLELERAPLDPPIHPSAFADDPVEID